MKEVLPDSDASRLFCERTPSALAQFIGIQSHAQQIVKKNNQRSNRKSDTEARHVSELYDSLYVLWKTVVLWKHDFEPNLVLSLI